MAQIIGSHGMRHMRIKSMGHRPPWLGPHDTRSNIHLRNPHRVGFLGQTSRYMTRHATTRRKGKFGGNEEREGRDKIRNVRLDGETEGTETR